MNRSIKVPKTLYRTGTSEVIGDDGTIRLSISSDTPYLRYDWLRGEEFYEVLDHRPGGMDATRLQAGAALLFNHDRDVQLGTINNPELRDGRCYVQAKISAAPDVESFRIRVQEKILKDSSVGYQIDDHGEEIDEKDGIPVIRFKWFPHEASLVTIPADITVGTGRCRHHNHEWNLAPDAPDDKVALKEIEIAGKKDVAPVLNNDKTHSQERETSQEREKNMETETPTKPQQKEVPQVDPIKVGEDAVREFQGRCQKIDDYVNALKNPAWQEVAREVAAKHKGGKANFDEFRTEALNSFEKSGAVTIPEKGEGLGLSKKDKEQFSLMRAIRTLAAKRPLDGREREISDAAAKAAKLEARPDAIYLPSDISEYDMTRDNPEFNARAFESFMRSVNVTAGTSGGFTVATAMGSMIEMLRNKTVLDRAGVTTISGLHGDLGFPVQTGGATAYWVSEEECVTDSAPTFAQKTLTPHRLSASIPFTTQFLAQTSLNAEQFLRNELMTVASLKIDNAGLEGTGVGGEPLGVKNTPGVLTDITFGGAAEWGDIVGFETYIATNNADIGTIAFIVSTATRGKWKTILRVTAGAAGDFLIKDNEANGYPVYATNQLSDNTVYFGVWSQLIHAMWDTQEIIVDPYALKKCGGIEITYNSFHDFLVRQPKAFEVSTDSGAA